MKYEAKRPGYMNVKEAAVTYEVSRAKLHRLIRLGRLPTESDPRDERATLLRTDDLDTLFRFPGEDAVKAGYETTGETGRTGGLGVLTSELRTRVDALRARVSAGPRAVRDSVDILRDARERRSAELFEYGSSGAGDDTDGRQE